MSTRTEMQDFFELDNKISINVKYLRKGVEPLASPDAKCNWVDLRAAEDVEIKQGDSTLIPLGIAMQLPEGYEAVIAPRSSTFKKWNIIQTNSIGVIDNSYCGDDDEWMMPVYAVRDTVIHKGDRICQFRIQKMQPDIQFVECETLGNSNRGGFGSTGTN